MRSSCPPSTCTPTCSAHPRRRLFSFWCRCPPPLRIFLPPELPSTLARHVQKSHYVHKLCFNVRFNSRVVDSNTFLPTRCKETFSFFTHLENEYRCPCHPQQQSSAFTAFSTLSLLSVPFFKKIIHPPQQQFASFDFCQHRKAMVQLRCKLTPRKRHSFVHSPATTALLLGAPSTS